VKTFYHMGFVVADLKAAMAELSSAMGVEWNEPLERELGPWKCRITFSKAGQPFLELIEAPPGGPWEAGTGPDHLGYWTDDLGSTKVACYSTSTTASTGDRSHITAAPGSAPASVGQRRRRDSGQVVHRVRQLDRPLGVPALEVAELVAEVQHDVAAHRRDVRPSAGLVLHGVAGRPARQVVGCLDLLEERLCRRRVSVVGQVRQRSWTLELVASGQEVNLHAALCRPARQLVTSRASRAIGRGPGRSVDMRYKGQSNA
jgi:hypothetical protein